MAAPSRISEIAQANKSTKIWLLLETASAWGEELCKYGVRIVSVKLGGHWLAYITRC